MAALGLLAACSGSGVEGQSNEPTRGNAGTGNAGGNGVATETERLPLGPDDDRGTANLGGASGGPGPSEADTDGTSARFSTFLDPDSDFQTSEVHDADREVVRFDTELGAMVWSANGDAVSNWSTDGNDLAWSGSGVAFRVRFGTEAGERRAFFTEADRGTICNLNISAPEALSIRATSELPPDP